MSICFNKDSFQIKVLFSLQMRQVWICLTVMFNTVVWTAFVTTCFLLDLTVFSRYFLISFRCLLGLSFTASKKDDDDCSVQKEKLCFATVPLIPEEPEDNLAGAVFLSWLWRLHAPQGPTISPHHPCWLGRSSSTINPNFHHSEKAKC